MTIPGLTAAPDLPDRTEQDQTTFDSKMAAYWAYLKNDFEPELNIITGEITSTASTINSNAYSANTSAINAAYFEASASATANYKGIWASLTGSLNIPASVFHACKNWQLLQNIADVTSIEPGTNNEYWFDLSVKVFENATISDRTIFNAARTDFIAKARLSDTQTLYAYIDSENYCNAIVATVSESGITFSNEFQVGQSNVSLYVSATAISDTKVAVTWYNTVDFDAYIRVLTYTSGTNTIAEACDAYKYYAQSSNNPVYSSCCAISSTKIAIFYNNPAVSSGHLYGQVLSLAGSVLNVATAATLIKAAVSTTIQSDLISGSDTSGKIFITFYTTSTLMSIVTWTSSGGFSYGTDTDATSGGVYSPVVILDTNTAIIFSAQYNSICHFYYGEIYLYYVGGSSPVLVRKHQFTKTGYPSNVTVLGNSATKIAAGKAALMIGSNSGEYTLFVFSASAPSAKINESTLKLLTEQSFSISSGNYVALSKTTDNNLLFAYRDSNNSYYGTIEKIEVDL